MKRGIFWCCYNKAKKEISQPYYDRVVAEKTAERMSRHGDEIFLMEAISFCITPEPTIWREITDFQGEE